MERAVGGALSCGISLCCPKVSHTLRASSVLRLSSGCNEQTRKARCSIGHARSQAPTSYDCDSQHGRTSQSPLVSSEQLVPHKQMQARLIRILARPWLVPNAKACHLTYFKHLQENSVAGLAAICLLIQFELTPLYVPISNSEAQVDAYRLVQGEYC